MATAGSQALSTEREGEFPVGGRLLAHNKNASIFDCSLVVQGELESFFLYSQVWSPEI